MKILAIVVVALLAIYYIIIPVVSFILGIIFAIAFKLIGIALSLALIVAVAYGLYRLIKGAGTVRSS